MCQLSIPLPYTQSCWPGSGGGLPRHKIEGCNLSIAHTHPYFIYNRDQGKMCSTDIISSEAQAKRMNLDGMKFSDADKNVARPFFVHGHLGVSDRSTVKAFLYGGRVVVLSQDSN